MGQRRTNDFLGFVRRDEQADTRKPPARQRFMHNSAEELFATALELTNPADRAALLDRECADNPALRAEVESLLAAHQQASKFLEKPPAAAVAETLAGTTGTVPVTEKPG